MHDQKEDLTKLGAIFGIYFLVQAYGYSVGLTNASLELPDEVKINSAVVFGFQHLSHILRPWDDYAWPLTPAIALPLVLYTIYLPNEFQKSEGFDRKSLRVYFSTLFGVLFFPLLSGLMGAQNAANISERSSGEIPRVIFCMFYAGAWFITYFFAYRIIFRPTTVTSRIKFLCEARPSMTIAVLTGLILFAVYLGSEFDGAMDRLRIGK